MILPEKSECRFLLLGGGKHICDLVKLLLERKFPKPIIITYPKKEHLRDQKLLIDKDIYDDIYKVAKKNCLTIIDNVFNNSEIIQVAKQFDRNIIFSLSWRNIISLDVIKYFNYKIFNIHPSILPFERGSGTFSYRILKNSNEVSATIHFVDTGVDTGNIVFQDKTKLNVKKPIPYDFLKNTQKVYYKLLKKFVHFIEEKKTLPKIKQNHKLSTYYPLLNTEVNGVINWNYSVNEIEKFIRAFSYPYPGASTYLNGKQRIHILKAKILEQATYNHPFLVGRVLRIDNNEADIIAKDGILRISQIYVNNEIIEIRKVLKLTTRLITPHEIIENAMMNVLKAKDMPTLNEKNG